MEKEEFRKIRNLLGKTQAQMAQLLSCSLKTIQSFEQGLRKVPIHVERHLLFILFNMRSQRKNMNKPCWKITDCSLEARRNCPAWEFQIGNLCWFINGTICHGEIQKTWQEKIKICRKCQVFRNKLPDIYE